MLGESGDVVKLDKLFVHNVMLSAGVSAIFLKDGGQVPALQFAQTSNDRASAMRATATHDHEGVDGGVQNQLERLCDGFFGDCVE